ncbi:Multicopper oxidase, type 3 [Lasallia pustulata]|uniref:Multicopper oxidase, type 3 n=1 Tax=Lasallia pustulata TaxID=136370 RepID=A0A1W5D8Y8_9LECA|nr:Multicopper oxidase, type 3 [Lasallia pustulata]
MMLDEDDNVEVTVHNNMPFNTSIHWHGLEQLGTPWADGVPGLSQKPIEPGCTYVYRFNASPYGTYWYHAHSRGNMQDGLYGSIYIQPKSGTPNPFHLISSHDDDIKAMQKAEKNPALMLVTDWDYLTSWEYMDLQAKTNLSNFCSDSILVNGKGNVYCPGLDFLVSLETPYVQYALGNVPVTAKGCFPDIFNTQGPFLNYSHPELLPPAFQDVCTASNGSTGNETIHVDAKDKWASINWISGASVKSLTVAIDEHPMWVYAVDGHYIEPQLVQTLSIWNGERYSVMIQLNNEPGNYTFRVADTGLDQTISAFATLAYAHPTRKTPTLPYINYAGTNVSADIVALNTNVLPPFNAPPVAKHADQMFYFQLGRLGYAWRYTPNATMTYEMDRSAYQPLLWNLESDDAKDSNFALRTKNGTWVDLIFQVGWDTAEPIEFPHSMHKHSNKAYIIGSNSGQWKWPSVDAAINEQPGSFDLDKPRYRDNFLTNNEGPAWIAVRYQVVNPGAWLLHCHIETHIQGGMAFAILDGVDVWPETPDEYKN